MQRSPRFAAGERGIRLAGALARTLGIEHRHGTDRGVQPLDACEVCVEQLERRHVLATDALSEFVRWEKGEFVHGSILARRAAPQCPGMPAGPNCGIMRRRLALETAA